MSLPYRIGRLQRQRTDGTRYWSYQIKWTDADGPHRVSLGTADKVAAATAARAFWQQRTLVGVNTVGQIVEAYLAEIEGTKGAKRKKEAWVAARPFWVNLGLGDVDLDTSRKLYPEQRQRATNTIRNELSLIRTALHWARDERKLVDTVPKIVLPAQPRSKVGHLTKAQFKTFLASCVAPHVSLFAQLAVTTGARKSAILQLRWEHVDFDRALLDLLGDADEVENKGRATVPLNDRILPVLREAQAGSIGDYIIEVGGLPIANIKNGIDAAARRCGIHCTPHMFRHSAAVWMAEDRVPMSEIAAYLGHRDSRITERVYARYHPDYLRAASRSLDW